ncbi:MAG TPA: crosslink repair DNA glycosylase YcaQ family protein [Solirubrobacteraceae bacterium]
MVEVISLPELRRHVVAWQGFASRARRARGGDVEEAIRRLSCVQLDSISTVERSHRIVLGSRVGVHPAEAVWDLVSSGRVIEYWAHEACLIPAEDHRLFRWRMRAGGHWGGHGRALRDHPDVVERVLARIREEGPLASRDFEGAGSGGMWNWKPAKSVLDALWDRGDLAIAGRRNGFQRLYDLVERVIPKEHLEAEEPGEDELLRELAVRAVEARGALTLSGIVEHYRLPGGLKRIAPRVAEVEEDGRLMRLRVADGGPDVFVPAGVDVGGRGAQGVLLSPFDNLLWDRPFAERLFDFKHVMEIYKPAPQRVYGYYVLPFLRGDRLVGRADLKVDRKASVLRVLAFHPEPGVRDSAALRDALSRALARLAAVAGVREVANPT